MGSWKQGDNLIPIRGQRKPVGEKVKKKFELLGTIRKIQGWVW